MPTTLPARMRARLTSRPPAVSVGGPDDRGRISRRGAPDAFRLHPDDRADRPEGRFAALADHLIAVEPDADLISGWNAVEGASRIGQPARAVGQIPICWDPDEQTVVARAHEQFRWFAGGWAVTPTRGWRRRGGLCANSPFWQGQDTAYASYRSRMQSRWPTSGPSEIFGSTQAYDRLVKDMVGTGAILDQGMVYFDARASHRYSTVEIRVADVCLDVDDAVLLAALCRGLVDQAATAASAGESPPPVPVSMLRLASWLAARVGMSGNLVDPITVAPRTAWEVIGSLLDHVRPALVADGDLALVEDGLERVRAEGPGAARQRRQFSATGRLEDVVADAVRVTEGEAGQE